jgi:S-adenosylmethionine-diacylglycerol 3-amino-3-carboxypropyl transferase
LQVGALKKPNEGLHSAIRQSPLLSRDGLLEYLFARAFSGLVYSQIWEDPEVDLAALRLTPDCHVVAIASGGCNVLSYLIDDPARITAVDLNGAHVALNRLKLAAARGLPDWDSFFRFFGAADEKANIDAYWRFLAPRLDDASRTYWEGRSLGCLGSRRNSNIARNAYHHRLLGYFIGLTHVIARLYGVDLREVLRARTREQQRDVFETKLAPLFDKRLIRWATSRRVSLYGLGIPPAQYGALEASGAGNIAAVLRERVERLACGFPIESNYFAWQAFGRTYPAGGDGPMPPYLKRENFTLVRDRAERVDVRHGSLTRYLEDCDDRSHDRYVLLDAQDWMSDAQLNALWAAISRTAKPRARVIFRTASEPSLLPGRLDPTILARWEYEAEQSSAFTARDRSGIYGGFHLYRLRD